jgi:hypothetical protein
MARARRKADTGSRTDPKASSEAAGPFSWTWLNALGSWVTSTSDAVGIPCKVQDARLQSVRST